ncbi:GNAT family N-acetyltransferase [Shewanella cyperi]|uniref:GNAT family N-acetyltransferase n=1 Tax=Shewanella cyperi TaxID=2814292 RepID=UPI001D18E58F|nr:GNAT family N-acetyltransferase [Shewanella cyperi]
MPQIRTATATDISQIAQLEQLHLADELSSDRGNLQGEGFDIRALTELATKQQLLVAIEGEEILGYVMAADWRFYGNRHIYGAIGKQLQRLGGFERSCQYGPVWVSPAARGTGVFQLLVDALWPRLAERFSHAVTFIAEDNERSFAAHTAKAGMQVLDLFGFEGRDFYLLARSLNSSNESRS